MRILIIEDEFNVIRLYKENKKIFLTVTNRGEEIPKGEEEKIFERFYLRSILDGLFTAP